MVALSLRFFLIAGAALAVSANVLPRTPAGTQFITGACKSDADCASGCCGFRTGKCAGAVIAQERDGGCGFGNATPNNNAAKKIQGANAEAAPGVPKGGAAKKPAAKKPAKKPAAKKPAKKPAAKKPKKGKKN